MAPCQKNLIVNPGHQHPQRLSTIPEVRSRSSQQHTADPTESHVMISVPESRHENGNSRACEDLEATTPQNPDSLSSIMRPYVFKYSLGHKRSPTTTPTTPPPPQLQTGPASPPPRSRPGVAAEGYALQPYRCAEPGLAELFDFREGDIITAFVHTSSLHPNTISRFGMRPVDMVQGPVYITRRIMVAIKLYNNSMLCLPMFSFGFAGIAAVPQQNRQDYVGVETDEELGEPEGFGGIRRIKFECFGPKKIHPACLVHLLGAVHVRYSNGITHLGHVPKESFEELMMKYNARQPSDR